MLGTMVAGLRCWDEHEAGGRFAWLALGCVLLATALALKIVSIYLVLPMVAMIRRPPRRAKLLLALGLVLARTVLVCPCGDLAPGRRRLACIGG